ncbi:hypothetical protein V9T40_002047 [Parthenolecanium corni]|uniref:Uncharacterized protein n=1 Tax=Parthenolecanium corni TaxID=536013 RepID=A0AAN9Y3R6_9HEMI
MLTVLLNARAFIPDQKYNACGPADTFDKEMVKRLNKNHYLANPNETSVNSHGSIGHSLINTDYHRGSNHRGYSTDGEDSRALSDRTMSEYMIANERTATSTLTTPPRKHRSRRSRSQERPPRAHSAASHHSTRQYDDNSDIYITSATLRPPSEIRYSSFLILYLQRISVPAL